MKSGGIVLHLGPALSEIGGMASVIRQYTEAELEPWRVVPVATFSTRSLLSRTRLLLGAAWRLAVAPRAQVAGVHIHVSQNFDLIRSAALMRIARLRGFRVVLTIHGSSFNESVDRYPRAAKALARHADLVTTLDQSRLRTVERLGAKRCILLPNPVDLAASTALGFDDVVVFAGEVGLRKGVDVLLAAWENVGIEVPTATLRLIGPIGDASVVAALPRGVELTGCLSHAELQEELTTASVAVLPSRAEAMPMFILEAMAAGLPVVATCVGGVPDLVRGVGAIVGVGDRDALAAAIVHFLKDRGAAEEAGRAGADRVREHYSREVVFRDVRAEYERVFG